MIQISSIKNLLEHDDNNFVTKLKNYINKKKLFSSDDLWYSITFGVFIDTYINKVVNELENFEECNDGNEDL